MENTKWIISSTMLIFYACTVMYMLLDVHFLTLSRKKKISSIAFFIIFIFFNIGAQIVLGYEIYGKFYLLFTQMPVWMLFRIVSGYHGIKLCFVLLTAVFFSSPIMILITVIRYFTPAPLWIYLLSFILLIVLVKCFLKKSFNYMLAYAENSVFTLFISIPLLYYIYNYSLTQYQLADIIVNRRYFISQIPLLIVLVSYLLLVQIFKMVSEKADLKNAQTLASVQLNTATKQIEQLRLAEKQSAIYRHDLRHHMNYLNACISENKLEDAAKYIRQTCEDIDNIKVAHYSENESVNLIISSYINKAREMNVKLDISITAADFERFQITDLCSLLANALENAIVACGQIDAVDQRFINLRMYEKSNKLCIQITNSYAIAPIFVHKIPVSQKDGHGTGVKSMVHVAEKYEGVYGFTAKDGIFTFGISL